jgi:hypothetical protein
MSESKKSFIIPDECSRIVEPRQKEPFLRSTIMLIQFSNLGGSVDARSKYR